MSPATLAPYVLRTLTKYQLQGKLCSLDTLVDEIRVRRSDLRRTVSALHKEGYLDALHMRPTLTGFCIGKSLQQVALPELRMAPRSCEVAA